VKGFFGPLEKSVQAQRGVGQGYPPALAAALNLTPQGLIKGFLDSQAADKIMPAVRKTEAQGVKAGKVGQFAGNVGVTLPLNLLPGGALAQGFVGGAALSDAKTPGGAWRDAALGAATGKAADIGLGLVGKGVSKVLAKAPKIMSPDELDAAKTAAYAAVDNAGVKYKKDAFADMVNGITAEVRAANISPTRHPKATDMLRDLQKMKGQTPTLVQLDQLRQVVRRDVANAPDQSEAFFGRKMIKNIDEFIDAAGPDQVIAGDANKGAAAIQLARDLNTRVRKTEAIQDALAQAQRSASATGSGANVDNRTRQEVLKQLRKTGNFTPDELAQVQKTIEGSGLQNTLRSFGKMSPLNGGIPALANTLMAAHNPGVLAFSIPASGAKVAADAMTRKNADDLVKLIAAGGSKKALAKVPGAASAAGQGAVEAARPVAGQLGAASAPSLAALLAMMGIGAEPPAQPQPARR
jgi:hypothetical protein